MWRGKAPGLLSGPVIIVVAVLLAWLTKVFVEDKVRLSPLLSGHGWRSVAVALAAAAPVALVWVYLASPVTWDGRLPSHRLPGRGRARLDDGGRHRARADPAADPGRDDRHAQYWLDNCLEANTASTEKLCTFGDTKNPVLTVAMVGGSIDGNWFPALEKIALQRHWKLVTDLHGTCEWTDTMLVEATTGSPYTACQHVGPGGAERPGDEDQAQRRDHVGLPEDGTVGHPTPGPAAFAAIGAGMAQYWTDLENHGIAVVAIKETPLMDFPEPDCVAQYGRNSPSAWCRGTRRSRPTRRPSARRGTPGAR